MTWSAGSTAITPFPDRAPTSAAPSATAAQVSRPHGSPMMLSLGNSGNCLRTAAACTALVMMNIFSSGATGFTRSTVCCRNERSPNSVINCFGLRSRLTGQKRSPRPPAMMIM